MSKMQEVVDAVLTFIDGFIFEFDTPLTLSMGALPAKNSYCLAVASGNIQDVTLANGRTYTIGMVLNGKNEQQKLVYNTLCDIHEGLNTCLDYPKGDGWQILDIHTASVPVYLGRDGTQWLYGSGIEVVFATEETNETKEEMTL